MTNVEKKVIGKLSSRGIVTTTTRDGAQYSICNSIYVQLYCCIVIIRVYSIAVQCIWILSVCVCTESGQFFLEIFGYDRCRAVARGGCVWRTRSGRMASCRAGAATAAALIRTPRVRGGWCIFFLSPSPDTSSSKRTLPASPVVVAVTAVVPGEQSTSRGAFEDKRREGTLREIVFLTLCHPLPPPLHYQPLPPPTLTTTSTLSHPLAPYNCHLPSLHRVTRALSSLYIRTHNRIVLV